MLKLIVCAPFVALLAVVLLVIALMQGGGNQPGRDQLRTDGCGDPFVIDAQFGAIRVGMSDSEAFRLLGGQGSSGSYNNGPGAIDHVPGRRRSL